MSKLDLKTAPFQRQSEISKSHSRSCTLEAVRSHPLENEGPLKEGPPKMRSDLKRLTPAYKENLSW
jgi:hypothetical protein